jgi:hypothetical protein
MARRIPYDWQRDSVLGVATALARNPEVTHAFVEGGHEIVSCVPCCFLPRW